ncbi:hypothetical protein ACTPOK_24365 [Streptomyces inhibens]|uniref:hypothetical protein n=1 Tax=Streptomyces inhibens TaxID=2293571 RepID=UPI00402A8908
MGRGQPRGAAGRPGRGRPCLGADAAAGGLSVAGAVRRTQVVNYSEWTDPESHEREVGAKLQRGGQVMAFIESLPGVEPLGFRRYVAPRGLVRA